MHNEFQRVIDLRLWDISFTNCYTDDILIGSEESSEKQKSNANRVPIVLEEEMTMWR